MGFLQIFHIKGVENVAKEDVEQTSSQMIMLTEKMGSGDKKHEDMCL